MANEKYRINAEKKKNEVEKWFGPDAAKGMDTSGEQKKPFERIISLDKVADDIQKNPLTEREIKNLQRGPNKRNKTGYKGVCFEPKVFKNGPDTNKYPANLTFRNQTIKLSRFDTAEDAAHAYNNAVIHLFSDIVPDLFLNDLPEHSQAKKWIKEG